MSPKKKPPKMGVRRLSALPEVDPEKEAQLLSLPAFGETAKKPKTVDRPITVDEEMIVEKAMIVEEPKAEEPTIAAEPRPVERPRKPKRKLDKWEDAHQRVTFYMPKSVLEVLEKEVAKGEQSKSAIIVDALRNHLGL